MSRHRRKRRPPAAAAPRPRPAAAAPPAPRPGRPERPRAPWHPFPLVELCVFVGIVLLVLGGLNVHSDRGRLMLVCGMALGSLGGLDTAVREHWAGYRSHTTVLAAAPAVVVAALLYFARAPWIAVVLGAGAVGVAAFAGLRRIYRR
ncbi:MAG TPA: hypothetical protein VH418_11625 [Solirubrobacteraceae bacterium]